MRNETVETFEVIENLRHVPYDVGTVLLWTSSKDKQIARKMEEFFHVNQSSKNIQYCIEIKTHYQNSELNTEMD